MKTWKHISFKQRNITNSLLVKKVNFKKIDSIIELDPTSVSIKIKETGF